MSLLEKMGLVERVIPYMPSHDDHDYYEEPALVDVEVSTDNVSAQNFVSDLYAANDLSDLSKSIFKIEEIRNTLPSTMPAEAKKATVTGILNSFGIQVGETVHDGMLRKETISIALNEINRETAQSVDRLEAEINELYKQVEEKKAEMQKVKDDYTLTETEAEKEIAKLQELIDFISAEKEEL